MSAKTETTGEQLPQDLRGRLRKAQVLIIDGAGRAVAVDYDSKVMRVPTLLFRIRKSENAIAAARELGIAVVHHPGLFPLLGRIKRGGCPTPKAAEDAVIAALVQAALPWFASVWGVSPIPVFRGPERGAELVVDLSAAKFWQAKGEADSDRGAWDEAFTAFVRSLAADPRRVDAWIGLTHVCLVTGCPDIGVFAARRAADLCPGDIVVKDLLASCCERILSGGKEKSDLRWELGRALIAAERNEEAVESFRRILVSTPENVEARYLLSHALRESGQTKEALEEARHANELAPPRSETWWTLARALFSANASEEAFCAYLKAVELAPPDAAQLREEAGDVLSCCEQSCRAIEVLRPLVEKDPSRALAWHFLGRAYLQMGCHDEARRCCEATLRADPEYAPGWLNLGCAESALGRAEGARAAYERALKLDPRMGAAWNNLGNLHHALGNLEAAITALRKAVSVEPREPRFWNNLYLRLRDSGRLEEAREALESLRRIAPSWAEGLEGLEGSPAG